MSSPNDNSTQTDSSQPDSSTTSRPSVLQNKIELVLACTRSITILCTILYIVPIFGSTIQTSAYQKALLANAATSAFRLQQRIPNFRFSMEFFNMLFLEDSAHYLFYSILFIFSRQITMVLLPIFLFALLHLLSFILKVCNETHYHGQIHTYALRFVEQYKIYMFQMIALSEITIMPICFFTALGDFSKLLILFPYYRFLVFRYISRRNPYNRMMFSELKNTAMHAVQLPQCPQIIRNLTYRMISFVTNLAPAMEHNTN